ncbi:MAG: phosphate acyltransferase PlsX [Caulobacteraceae bacterium]|nr:phosphate acyltransferase PlsX [Caulobacter sp.]RYF95306.1 MAG: phosphate acyltransferase PlsX [Caulobacteraceae bacterium]
MSEPLILSVDAMGGDHGPSVVIPALGIASRRLGPGVRFLVHGDEAKIGPELARLPALAALAEVRHTEKFIAMDEKPAQAMRRGKGSSLWNAVQAVKDGQAVAAVSAGNTGALMAVSMLILRMGPDINRPALTASWPTASGITTVLDVGANVSADAEQLVEFAIMGAAFHHAIQGGGRPTVGLLNVGSEDQKGHEEVREAHALLKATAFEFDYHGFVEGDDIAKGTVDVVVTDGFTGNILLKTAEGVVRFIASELRGALKSSPLNMLGALLATGGLKILRAKLDPGAVNGAPLLGLNGIVIKSHGSADARSYAAAVVVAADLARSDFAAEIDRSVKQLSAALAKPLTEPEVK